MQSTIQSPDIKQSSGKKPASRWRNKWRAREDFLSLEGIRRRRDEVYPSRKVWPSKEIAEEKADRTVREVIAEFGYCHIEHLGAFPIDGE